MGITQTIIFLQKVVSCLPYIKGGWTNAESPFGLWEVQEWGFSRPNVVKESRRKRKFFIRLGKAEKGIRSV